MPEFQINLPADAHGGILLPLDMFRITGLASLAAEALASKARNIVDATMTVTRHPTSQLLLLRIEGSVVGPDPVQFWRENADLALLLSQALPRECFLYYARSGAERQEGFIVAQRGQVLAADEASHQTVSAQADEDAWPLPKLCKQMRISLDDLATGFEGGPRVKVSLVDPTGDDQHMLMVLAGQAEPDDLGASAGGGAGQADGGGVGADPSGAAAGSDDTPNLEAELKRRQTEAAEEREALARRADQVASDLKSTRDELGFIVVPDAELGETDVLRAFVVQKVEGDLPAGVPRDLAGELQGKRIDIAIRVDFLSEVFVDNTPLTKAVFEASSRGLQLDGTEVRAAEVLAPRIGYGTLLRHEGKNVFISRKPSLPLPGGFLLGLLRD